jgi:hypothetical protein
MADKSAIMPVAEKYDFRLLVHHSAKHITCHYAGLHCIGIA